MLSGTTAPTTNCAQNNANNMAASRLLRRRSHRQASANTDCAAVNRSSSRWLATMGSPCRLWDVMAKAMGSVPTRSVHWLTLDDTNVPSPDDVLSLHAYSPATTS